MNEVVKYDNYMNSLKFTGFTTTDFNFLMLLCSKMRDKDIKEITIPFDELRLKTGYTRTSIQQFVSDLKRMNDKLMKITCNLETEKRILMFVLFPTFDINIENQTLTVCVNERFKFVLNEIVRNFTRFDLNEFVKLDSKYSKTLYRLLKQFKTTGIYEVMLGDFRGRMDIPATYTNRDVMSKVINPSVKELRNYFQDLQCTVKYEHKRGKPVSGYIFTFAPEQIPKSESKELPAEVTKPSEPRMNISQQEMDKLINEFGKELTEDYIMRTSNYKCCTYDTIRQWILEDKGRKIVKHKVNEFNQFTQQYLTDADLLELEQKLVDN